MSLHLHSLSPALPSSLSRGGSPPCQPYRSWLTPFLGTLRLPMGSISQGSGATNQEAAETASQWGGRKEEPSCRAWETRTTNTGDRRNTRLWQSHRGAPLYRPRNCLGWQSAPHPTPQGTEGPRRSVCQLRMGLGLLVLSLAQKGSERSPGPGGHAGMEASWDTTGTCEGHGDTPGGRSVADLC